MIATVPLAFSRHASEIKTTPPLAVVHGLYGAARNWSSLSNGFARKRETLAVDLRGHGASPWAHPLSYEAMAADLGAFIAREAGGKADVLGHSMGGKVAMTLALTQPERVRRLIVADMAPKAYDHGQQGEYAKAMLALDLSSLSRRSEADKLLAEAIPEASMRAFLMSGLVTDPETGALRWRPDLQGLLKAMPGILGWELPPGARPFEGETLFLSGGLSDYVRKEDHAAILKLFPRARFEVVPEAAHWLHADKPIPFRDAVEAFLA